MKRAKKLMPTILLLAFIIFAVGIGIHVLHRDALAQNHYKIIVCDAGWEPIANHPVSLQITGELKQNGVTDEYGVFECLREGDPSDWKAWVYDTENWEFEVGFPVDDPIASLEEPCLQRFVMRNPEE